MWKPFVNTDQEADSVASLKLVGFCLPLYDAKSASIPTVFDTPK